MEAFKNIVFVSLLSEAEISGTTADGNKVFTRFHPKTIFIISRYQFILSFFACYLLL